MNEFEKAIRNMIDLFGELVETEQQKLDAAAAHDVQVLEECVTKEQALQLRLRGLERSREKAQEQAGFGGLRFREILDRLPRDDIAHAIVSLNLVSSKCRTKIPVSSRDILISDCIKNSSLSIWTAIKSRNSCCLPRGNSCWFKMPVIIWMFAVGVLT